MSNSITEQATSPKTIIVEDAGLMHQFKWDSQYDSQVLVAKKEMQVTLEKILPHTSAALDFYKQYPQFFLVLNGVATIRLEHKTIILKKGEGLLVDACSSIWLSNRRATLLSVVITAVPSPTPNRQPLAEA